ncbi:FAD binding domain-containing protein [Hydrogenophaga laconesensis]|nr:xanthine dehydrogenase family protein subunit M [Hydrogenophaga laconesensis]
MYPFAYLRPASVQEAVDCLARFPDARPLSGGMTLVPTLKQRLSAPSHLVDLSRLPELQGIAQEDGVLRIGAATRHAAVAQSDTVRRCLPALSGLAGLIGDQQVRNRGTMGGSVANSDPAADYPAAVLALKATLITDRRRIESDAFFLGMFETALEPTEILTAIEFRVPDRAAYVKHRHAASGYAVVGVFIADHRGEVRVAVTGAGPCAFRWTAAEERLAACASAGWNAGTLAGMEPDASGFNADATATRAYRAHLVGVLAGRALSALGATDPQVN